MWKRIVTAVVLLAVVLGTLFGLRQISPFFADGLGLLVLVLGVYEMVGAFKKAEYRPMAIPLIIGLAAVFPLTYFFSGTGIVLTISLIAIAAIVTLTFCHTYDLKDLFATVFIGIYPIAIFSGFFVINASTIGMLGILLMIAVPIMTDTMAYFVGVTCKGKKLCPTISPKKTISGAIGGVVGGILGSMLVYLLFDVLGVFAIASGEITSLSAAIGEGAALAIYLTTGVVGGVVSELGDLGASWIKRKAGIKDFGKIFPGHGGMMDRLDSILFMIPIVLLVGEIVVLCL